MRSLFVALCLCLMAWLLAGSAKAQPLTCTENVGADIMIVIDKTGSINDSDLSKQKTAAKNLLKFFQTNLNPLPRVGVVTFSCKEDEGKCNQGEATNLPAGLTNSYGTSSPATGLFAKINSIDNPGGYTYLNHPINRAQYELDVNGTPGTPNYIVLISDGVVNRPPPNYTKEYNCPTNASTEASISAANIAKAKGTTIITVHFPGHENSNCSGQPAKGKDLLQNQIASAPDLFYAVTDDITPAFLDLAEAILCDDGDFCTNDSCNVVTRICSSELIDPSDTDGDGVTNCYDQCPTENDSLLGTSCSQGLGVCQASGVLQCVADNLECSATPGQASAETCNLLDDDCDGATDEGIAPQGACSAGVGACQKSGQIVCTAGAFACNAVPSAPSAEVCNGIDDDCDGQVDEGIASTGSCNAGVGACQSKGELVCQGGSLVCDAVPSDPSAEVCNGLDDDCDGLVDEDIPSAGSCSSGVGSCEAQGELICQSGSFVCDAKPVGAGTELCNGLDDDCDGTIDNGFNLGAQCSVGIGACQALGKLVCAPDGGTICDAQAGPPQAELCDNVDNDCNGLVDDGAVCACTEISLAPITAELDGIAQAMAVLTTKLTKRSTKASGLKVSKSKLKTLNSTLLKAVQGITNQIWETVNVVLPQSNLVCPSTVTCVSISSAPTLAQVSADFAAVLAKVNTYIKKIGIKDQKALGYVKQLKKLQTSAKVEAAKYPLNVTSCPGAS